LDAPPKSDVPDRALKLTIAIANSPLPHN